MHHRAAPLKAWFTALAGILTLLAIISFLVAQGASADGQSGFPSSVVEHDPRWKGPLFWMSQSYPQTPFVEKDRGEWMGIDFHTRPAAYSEAILDYCLEGNWQVGFRGQFNPKRKWYHAPYMHPLPKGREYISGLTYELPSAPGKLDPRQGRTVQNWAVAMYNGPGGYTVGKYWADGRPSMMPVRFARGTVAFKLLFTEATPDEVPALKGAPEVWASIYDGPLTDGQPVPQRHIQKLRLLQIDIAVRDPHAEADALGNQHEGSGWVFLSYQYSGLAPQRPVRGMPPWFYNMRPLGMMWGNDSRMNTPTQPLKHTILTLDRYLPTSHTHYGWGGRLNGPVDNPKSSCLSCHSTAQTPHIDQAFPPDDVVPGSPKWMGWFRTLPAGTPFTDHAASTDYSLQLAKGVRNYLREHNSGSSHTLFTTVGPGQPIYDVDRGK